MSFAALLSASCLTSCKEEFGTEPGNDSKAVATVYQYEPGDGYNADNDVALRFVGNSKVKEMYYLSMPTADYEEALLKLGEAGMIENIIKEGTKMEFVEDALEGIPTAETVLTNLVGSYTIAVASVGNGGKTLSSAVFVGLEWETLSEGYYMYGAPSIQSIMGSQYSDLTVVEHCITAGKENLYRIVAPYGQGTILKLEGMGADYTYFDGDGYEYEYVRINKTPTGFSYGSYGAVTVCDIAAWQGSASFASNASYCSYIYHDDGYAVLSNAYLVSAGCLEYGSAGSKQDMFVPAAYFE